MARNEAGKLNFWGFRKGRKRRTSGGGRRVDVRGEGERKKTKMARRVDNEAREHC